MMERLLEELNKQKVSVLKLRRDVEIHILNFYQDLTVGSGSGDIRLLRSFQAHIIRVMVK